METEGTLGAARVRCRENPGALGAAGTPQAMRPPGDARNVGAAGTLGTIVGPSWEERFRGRMSRCRMNRFRHQSGSTITGVAPDRRY